MLDLDLGVGNNEIGCLKWHVAVILLISHWKWGRGWMLDYFKFLEKLNSVDVI